MPDALASLSFVPSLAVGVPRVGDPEATRTVYVTIAILVALGVMLLALAVWVFRRTRPDLELLAPLETMDTRAWHKLDPATQRRLLDEARPAGAKPLRPQASAPAVDSSFATIAPVASFDDLSELARLEDLDEAELAQRESLPAPTGAPVAVDPTGEVESEAELVLHTPVEIEVTTVVAEVASEPDNETEPAAAAGADEIRDETVEVIDDAAIDDGDVEREAPWAGESIDPLVPPMRRPEAR